MDAVDKMVSEINSLATPLQDLILHEAMSDMDYANKAAAELAALRKENEQLRAELQRVKDLAKQAQEKLQATQYNWMEECLFECNDLLDEINPQPFASPDPTPITRDEILAGG